MLSEGSESEMRASFDRQVAAARATGHFAEVCLSAPDHGVRESWRGPGAQAAGASFQTKFAALCDAVGYVLRRRQEDPDLGYYLGRGTEAFHRLCLAEATVLGTPLEEIERTRGEDLQPSYRRREPAVVELRARIEELEGQS